jgi:acetolactate synthase-1/2/3 large subunit
VIIADFLVDFLIKKKITDIFGIPGGSVLELLYATNRRKNLIKPHLSFHEQNAVFAASGYAIAGKKLGVAYATRGPGITNMVTAITDAYCDSIPLLIITAHSSKKPFNNMRVFADQEIDTVKLFSGITKYCARIDNHKNARYEIEKAYFYAMNGRKGPVVLDFNTKIFFKETNNKKFKIIKTKFSREKKLKDLKKIIQNKLLKSKRPIFLIGDGFRYSNSIKQLTKISEKNKIPIISTRYSQDMISRSINFFGYFGSHGLRYSNFILSKADLIICLGNRYLFLNNRSKSFKSIFANSFIFRVDIDKSELTRKIPKGINYHLDLKKFLIKIKNIKVNHENNNQWLKVCRKIKKELFNSDYAYPITAISELINFIPNSHYIVSDVGNNEFWLCRAYAHSGSKSPVIYSKSFGAMGSSLGKAIGVYYATLKPVFCFVGDQALQMCIQELHFLSKNKLPVTIVLLNNSSSGMIRSRQKWRYSENYLHTTPESGYSVPNFIKIAESYGIKTYKITSSSISKIKKFMSSNNNLKLLEIVIDPAIEMIPNVPESYPFQKMLPKLEDENFFWLESL